MKKLNFLKLMKDENIILETDYNKGVIIGSLMFSFLYSTFAVILYFLLYEHCYSDTLFSLLFFKTPILTIFLLIFNLEIIGRHLFGSYLITNKRIIINRGGCHKFMTKKSSILLDEITEIVEDPEQNIIEIQYKNKLTNKKGTYTLYSDDLQKFIQVLQNQIKLCENESNYIDSKNIKRAVNPKTIRNIVLFIFLYILFSFLFFSLILVNLDKSTIITAKFVKLFNPNNAIPYISLGNVYKEKENYDLASKYFKKAIELDSKNPAPYIRLANTYYEKGLYDKAIEYKEKVPTLLKDIYLLEYKNEIKYTSKDGKKIYLVPNCGFNLEELKNKKLIEKTNTPYKCNSIFLHRCSKGCSSDFEKLGDFYSQKNEFNKAINCYKKSIFHDLNNKNSRKKLNSLYEETSPTTQTHK